MLSDTLAVSTSDGLEKVNWTWVWPHFWTVSMILHGAAVDKDLATLLDRLK